MNYLLTMVAPLVQAVPYRDVLEILFFASAIYYIQLWLKRDTERNLILGFYTYCALFFASYYADLPILRFVLFVFAPAIGMLFIILHQETLQKNFISFRKPASIDLESNHWIDELVMCCLTALNKHKDTILVLERHDPLKGLIQSPYFIYAELKKDVFDILLEKQFPGNQHMIWINQQGKIVSINSSWKSQVDDEWVTQEAEHLHVWKQQALYITSKTDALVLKINPLSRSFDVIIQGTIIENMKAETITVYLKKRLLQHREIKEKPVLLEQQTTASRKSL